MKTNFNPLLGSDIETVGSRSPKTDIPLEEVNQYGNFTTNNNRKPNRRDNPEDIFGYDRQPEHRVGYRTYFAAFFLFFGGLALLITGAVEYWQSEEPRGLDMFIIGLIMMLPGTYGMTIVIGHLRGWLGYDSGSLPLYD